ncbi:protein PHLOEM PROTEIN 2-LIKE A1-like [Mangifera indica]|uniref:protein PHLOEM PROTEIN 2-LIKE A1-like n=1 Tax=Mangifera indica TaxID=29780 RepID=UPI001CF9EEB3|nr:protein PHLOEM PROTEIN 2-LIKE A1-like [Mangifera indica]
MSLQLPHNYHGIVQDAFPHIDMSSNQKFYDQLFLGVFLNNNQTKYRVDESKINSFVLYAKTLSITWGDDERYWKWTTEEERSGVYVEVAELIMVNWVEVKGKFNTDYLTPRTL